jgi:hypothetical protein
LHPRPDGQSRARQDFLRECSSYRAWLVKRVEFVSASLAPQEGGSDYGNNYYSKQPKR